MFDSRISWRIGRSLREGRLGYSDLQFHVHTVKEVEVGSRDSELDGDYSNISRSSDGGKSY